jgi:tetratricopeptide (TPR) repeat protein
MKRICRAVIGAAVFAAAVTLAAPALAQTGGVRGKVTDAEGKGVDGAAVHIESKSMSRKLDVKTNKKGEYVQIGLYPGDYTLTAEKGDLKASADTRVGLGDPTVVDIQLRAAQSAQADQNAKVRQIFEEGVAAAQAEKYDDAVAKFNEAAGLVPNCHICYYNIGSAYAKKEDWVKAEEGYKKSVEIKPDYVEGWNALASLYNQQKKYDLATQASEKAAAAGGGAAGAAGAAGGGANASALYNQGVILWNQNKYTEAKDKWEAATKADPKYADAFYRLGMAYMNLGDSAKAVTAFEGYLQADPNGSHAAEVKQAIDALKPKQ